jgi:hypothetical protein
MGISTPVLAGVREVLKYERRTVRHRRDELEFGQRLGPKRREPAGITIERQTVYSCFQDNVGHGDVFPALQSM